MSARRAWSLMAGALLMVASVSAHATSHVRIVRLSYIDGQVQMDRANGQGLERAILNAPVVEGSRIVTGRDGLAEVEFEDNGTVRLGEATEVFFRQLLINDAGDKVNEIELVRGTMYFDTKSGKRDIDRVIAADHTFVLRHDSQIRFVMNGDQVQAAALAGELQLDNNGQFEKVKKNETLTAASSNPAATTIAKGVDSYPLDRWNSERAAYQNAYAYNNVGYGSHSMSTYGYQDLAYYGNFMTLPNVGLVWQPYGASSWLGWDPYLAGGWAFTPGFGYMWASAYPWGWLPYHWGAWSFQPTIGWVWCPGAAFSRGGVVNVVNNVQAVAPVVNAPSGYRAPAPPVAPVNGNHPSMLVGRIGNVPAYLPDGPVPPNFRSVIQDHSGVGGMGAPSFGGKGAGGNAANANSAGIAARNSRAVNPTTTNRSGHVFVAPQTQTVSARGYMSPSMAGGAGVGPGSAPVYNGGAPMRSSGGMTSASGGRSAAAPSGGHGGAGANPK